MQKTVFIVAFYCTIMFLSIIVAISLLYMYSRVYVRWEQTKRYWADRGVPHHQPHPFMGSLTYFLRQNNSSWLRDIYNQFKSPYVGIWLFWRPALLVNCPALARRVLLTDCDVFRDRFQNTTNANDTVASLQLFTVKEPLWSFIRKCMTPVFTPLRLKFIQNISSTKANELVQRLLIEIENQKLIDLRSVFADFTTDVISIATLGVRSDATLTGESPFRSMTKHMMRFDVSRYLAWCSIFFFPEMTGIFRFTFYPKSVTDSLRKILKYIEAQHEVNQNTNILNALLKLKKHSSYRGKDVSEDLMLAQVIAFLQGGFDTTALILTFAVYELAFAPVVQEKLYAELLGATKSADTKKENGIPLCTSQLLYLNSTINETLRKYAAVGFIERVSSKEYKIDENLAIPAGTPVYVNGVGMRYDTNFFPEPKMFKPERFLPENQQYIKPFTFLPFGQGPRHCIGERFAMAQLRAALATVVHSFKLSPVPGARHPCDLDFSAKDLFLVPKHKLSVHFVPR